MRVAEYPLSMLHWVIRRDPWVRAIFLAAGVKLDELAERILDVSTFEDSEAMMSRSLALWERILGLEPEAEASMEERRADVRAMWLAALPPSIASLQAICDAWRPGGFLATYDTPGLVRLWFDAGVGYRRPPDLNKLLEALGRVKPAHLDYGWGLRPRTRPAALVGYMAAFWVTPMTAGHRPVPVGRPAVSDGYPAAAAGAVEIHVTLREED